jgi:hypothetical protein
MLSKPLHVQTTSAYNTVHHINIERYGLNEQFGRLKIILSPRYALLLKTFLLVYGMNFFPKQNSASIICFHIHQIQRSLHMLDYMVGHSTLLHIQLHQQAQK